MSTNVPHINHMLEQFKANFTLNCSISMQISIYQSLICIFYLLRENTFIYSALLFSKVLLAQFDGPKANI